MTGSNAKRARGGFAARSSMWVMWVSVGHSHSLSRGVTVESQTPNTTNARAFRCQTDLACSHQRRHTQTAHNHALRASRANSFSRAVSRAGPTSRPPSHTITAPPPPPPPPPPFKRSVTARHARLAVSTRPAWPWVEQKTRY